jgi:flagellar biogenesis protein FliO
MFGLTLLLALPGLSMSLSRVSQAQSFQVEHPDHWRQDYRAQWRKQWLAEHTATTSPAKKPDVPARPATVTPAQTKSDKQTPSSAPTLSAAPPQTVAKSDGAQHTAAHSTVTPQRPASVANTQPVSYTKPVPAAAIQNSKPSIQNQDVLAQTRPDLFTPEEGGSPSKSGDKTGSHLQDNPFAPVGDAWKMLAYLVPMLLVIVGCLNLLKRFQTRTGRLPGVLQSAANSRQGRRRAPSTPRTGGIWNALLGSFHLNNAREQAGHSIRVIESVPIGGANVHLLEVRGRVLLLGAAAGGMSLLAEFDERAEVDPEDFRDLLHAAAADMDALDYAQNDLPAVATMSVLEDLMRDTGQAVAQRSRRLRTVQEVEGEE